MREIVTGKLMIAIYAVMALVASEISSAAQSSSLPTTEQFINIMTVCGAGIGVNINADIQGSIRSLYAQERTQGKAIQDILPSIFHLIPQADQLNVYDKYLGCVKLFVAQNQNPNQIPSTTKSSPNSGLTFAELFSRAQGHRSISSARIGLECCYGAPRGYHEISLYVCGPVERSIICIMSLTNLEKAQDYEAGKDNFWNAKLVGSDHVEHPMQRGYFVVGQAHEQRTINLGKDDTAYLAMEFRGGDDPVTSGRIVLQVKPMAELKWN